MTVCDGYSLRARLTKDKEDQLAGRREGAMHKLYFTQLREQYRRASASSELDVNDEDEPENTASSEALQSLFDKKKRFEKMFTFLACGELVNQRSLVGIFRACLMFNPISSDVHRELAINLMYYLQRHDARKKYPSEVVYMSSYFNKALVKANLTLKANKLTKSEFWERYSGILDLVLPKADAEVCLACEDDWADVETQLANCVRAGELGKHLFSSALGPQLLIRKLQQS